MDVDEVGGLRQLAVKRHGQSPEACIVRQAIVHGPQENAAGRLESLHRLEKIAGPDLIVEPVGHIGKERIGPMEMENRAPVGGGGAGSVQGLLNRAELDTPLRAEGSIQAILIGVGRPIIRIGDDRGAFQGIGCVNDGR